MTDGRARFRTVLWAGLAVLVVALAVRVVRAATGDDDVSLIAYVAGVSCLIGLAVFAGYLTRMFLGLITGIWSERIDRLREWRAGTFRPFSKFREEGGASMLVIGMVIEAFLYWFLFLSAAGVVLALALVGLFAWHGSST